jgi:hypothetical protein
VSRLYDEVLRSIGLRTTQCSLLPRLRAAGEVRQRDPLQHGADTWLDLQLRLWHTLADTVELWARKSSLPGHGLSPGPAVRL